MTKDFFKRWKKGIMELTPKQQLQSKIIGSIGTIVGVIFAYIFLMLKLKMWYFSIAFFFIIFLQVISLIGIKQQLKQIIKFENMRKDMEFPQETKGSENET